MKLLIGSLVFLTLVFASVVDAFCPLSYSYVSGFHRICVYRCIDGEVAITIDRTNLCPLTLDEGARQ